MRQVFIYIIIIGIYKKKRAFISFAFWWHGTELKPLYNQCKGEQ